METKMEQEVSKKKALFVATVFKFLNFEKSDIGILKDMGYEIHTATNMSEEDWLSDDGSLDYLNLKKHQIDFKRSPFSKASVRAYRQLKKLLKEQYFDVIHCHTPVAAAILRLAAIGTRKKGTKIIYTDHGFHFHKTSPKINWLLFYPLEFFLSYFTDLIITINKEDFDTIRNFPVKNKKYIPGVGVDTISISNTVCNKAEVKDKLGLPLNSFIVLSIGELSKRKNQEIIIRALAELHNKNIYYLLCGTGSLKDYLKQLSESLGVSDNIIFAGYQSYEDIKKIVHVIDIGALPSRIEGLGLAGIEMMAAGKPLVASGIHGIKDYVVDNVTGITCDPEDITAFSHAIQKLYSDVDLYKFCSDNALLKSRNYDIACVRKMMSNIYKEILC